MKAIDPEAIASKVAACRDVEELSSGPNGTVATYLPGKQVVGVRVYASVVEIHVVGRWGVPIPTLAARIRRAVAPLAALHAIDIVVEDLGEPT